MTDLVTNTVHRKLTGTIGQLINNVFDYVYNLIDKIDKTSTPSIWFDPGPEKEKYETIQEYIQKHVNIENQKNTVFNLLNIDTCEELVNWFTLKLNELLAKLAGSTNSLDRLLDNFKKKFPLLKIIDELLSGKISLSTILKIVRSILETLMMTVAGVVIEIADKIYETYREVKVFIGKELVIFNVIKNIDLYNKCKCNHNCELVRSSGLGICPVKFLIDSISTLVNAIQMGVDTATLPIDQTLSLLNQFLSNDLVKQVCPRNYYSVTVSDVMQIVEEMSLYGSTICTGSAKTISRKPITSAVFGSLKKTTSNIKGQLIAGVNSKFPSASSAGGCISDVIKSEVLNKDKSSNLTKSNINSNNIKSVVGPKLSQSEVFTKLDSVRESNLKSFIEMYKSSELGPLMKLYSRGKLFRLNELGDNILNSGEFRSALNKLDWGVYYTLQWNSLCGNYDILDELIISGHWTEVIKWLNSQ